jgi:hypothetical protein
VLHGKPLDKLVEATITLETGGSQEQKGKEHVEGLCVGYE